MLPLFEHPGAQFRRAVSPAVCGVQSLEGVGACHELAPLQLMCFAFPSRTENRLHGVAKEPHFRACLRKQGDDRVLIAAGILMLVTDDDGVSLCDRAGDTG
ncbi:hypothetical protein AQ810_01305 [Burkholderia pseudomallei]|nr:hypothetical protein AQ810_01305 [Burkholderia pseudomallei]